MTVARLAVVRIECRVRVSWPPAWSGQLWALLAVGLEEVADAADGLLQVIDAGQGDDAEVIRPRPVEGGALDDQQLLGEQQVEHELLVVVDRADLRVDLREGIQRAHGFDATDTGDVVE